MQNTREDTLNSALQAFPMEELYDCLPDVVYFVKDRQGRYFRANKTLIERCGYRHKEDLIGKTPTEVMGELLGKGYEAQDQVVTETGTPVTDQLELHNYAHKKVGWCVTNKHPLIGTDNRVVGIVGISQDLRQPDLSHEDFVKLSDVIEYVQENLDTSPSVDVLSKLANMSPFQLDLRIQRIFGLTTGQWVLKQRIEYARHQLLSDDAPIIDIALASGYSDQSTFTRQFRKITGLTPLQLRKTRS